VPEGVIVSCIHAFKSNGASWVDIAGPAVQEIQWHPHQAAKKHHEQLLVLLVEMLQPGLQLCHLQVNLLRLHSQQLSLQLSQLPSSMRSFSP